MKKLLVLILALCPFLAFGQYVNPTPDYQFKGQVSVGTDTDSYVPSLGSAWLTVGPDSTNKGMILPRVVDTSDIANPVMGMTIFQIKDSTEYYFNGEIWEKDYENSSDIILDSLHRYTISGPAPSYITNFHSAEGVVLNLGGDTLINIFRLDTVWHQNHTGDSGMVVQRYSYNAGLTWTTPTTIYNSQWDDRNISGGLMDDNRIEIWLRRYNSDSAKTVDIGYIYSNDNGGSWSDYTILNNSMDSTAVEPFGPIVRGGDGNYFRTINDVGTAQLWTTTDNGLNWDSVSYVFDTAYFDEPYLTYVGDNRMIVLSRDSKLLDTAYAQFTSSDNGQTWAFMGRVNMNEDEPVNSSNNAPFIAWDSTRNIVIAVSTERNRISSGINHFNGLQDQLNIYINRPDSVFNNTNNYTLRFQLFRPSPDLRPLYGYPTMCKLDNGNYFFIFTDEFSRNTDTVFFSDHDENADLWQFDINYTTDYLPALVPPSRYSDMVPIWNPLMNHFDTRAIEFPWAIRPDSVLLNRFGSTIDNFLGDGGSFNVFNREYTNLFKIQQSTGNVGIGTSEPFTGLDVKSGTTIYGILDVGRLNQAGSMVFRRGNSESYQLGTYIGWAGPTENSIFKIQNNSGNGQINLYASGASGSINMLCGGGSNALGVHINIGGTVSLDNTPVGSAGDDSLYVKKSDGTMGIISPTYFASQTGLDDSTASIRSSIIGGSASVSGDGTTTAFTISISSGFTPSQVIITPTSEDAAKAVFYVSAKTSTSFTVTSTGTTPPSGTNNVTFDYELIK